MALGEKLGVLSSCFRWVYFVLSYGALDGYTTTYQVHVFWKNVKNVKFFPTVLRTVRSEINGMYYKGCSSKEPNAGAIGPRRFNGGKCSVVQIRPPAEPQDNLRLHGRQSLEMFDVREGLGFEFSPKQNRHFLVVFPEVCSGFFFTSTEYPTSPVYIYFSSPYARKVMVRLRQDWRTGRSKCRSFPLGQVWGGGCYIERWV